MKKIKFFEGSFLQILLDLFLHFILNNDLQFWIGDTSKNQPLVKEISQPLIKTSKMKLFAKIVNSF